MIIVNNKYDIGSEVYLKTDPEQLKRIIVSVESFADGSFVYVTKCGMDGSKHFEIEISEEKVLS